MSQAAASTFDRVKQIVIEQLGLSEDVVTISARFDEDFEADSLDLIELTLAAEEEFDIEIQSGEADFVKTVGDIVVLVDRRLKARHP